MRADLPLAALITDIDKGAEPFAADAERLPAPGEKAVDVGNGPLLTETFRGIAIRAIMTMPRICGVHR